MHSPRPLWRWWLFCAALWLSFETRWRWSLDLMGWSVRGDWLGDVPAPSCSDAEVPF